MPGERQFDMNLSNRCGICQHNDVLEINWDLASGQSITSTAVKFDLSKQTLSRHWREHVMVEESPQGLQVISIQDVLNIPLQMRERNQLITAMLERLLEPIMGSSRKYKGVDYLQGGLIARLLRIQQIDEQTVLKITGVLREDGHQSADLAMTQQYAMLQAAIDERLEVLAQGDGDAAAAARQLIADVLYPMSEVPLPPGTQPFTYTDLGPVGDNE